MATHQHVKSGQRAGYLPEERAVTPRDAHQTRHQADRIGHESLLLSGRRVPLLDHGHQASGPASGLRPELSRPTPIIGEIPNFVYRCVDVLSFVDARI